MDPIALQNELLARADQMRRHIRAKMPPALLRTVAEDDILQDACAAAFRQARSFDLGAIRSMDAWITMIVNQCVADTVRSRLRLKRGGQAVHVPCNYNETSCLDLFQKIAGPQPTPSSEIAIREAVGSVRLAVSLLPADQRRAIELHHFEGKSYADVSATMQKTVPAVRGLLQRAVDTLRSEMGHPSQYFSDVSRSADIPDSAPRP